MSRTRPTAPDVEEPPTAGSWIELDASCFEANIQALRDHIAPAELCMVVKGNAYGHGYDPMVSMAEAAGVRRFAVFSAREAYGFLRASDGNSRLMVMGHAAHENLPWIVGNDLEPWINDPHDWPVLVQAAEQQGRTVKVHLELETGMHRTGLVHDDARRIAKEIVDHDLFELEGVCTHFAGRESSDNDARIARQRGRFNRFIDELNEGGIRPNIRHVASTAAALLDPDCRMDLCRVGIACYGLWPSQEVMHAVQSEHDLVLRNVMQWKARVVALKEVEDGDHVGYGLSYEAEGNTRIAVVGVGYSDGFARGLSNIGYVLVRGKRASIVGTVGMNMIQVHVGHIPDVGVDDEVVLIGRQGEREISVASFSDFNSIVNYELMSRLNHDLPRIIVASEPVAPPLQ